MGHRAAKSVSPQLHRWKGSTGKPMPVSMSHTISPYLVISGILLSNLNTYTVLEILKSSVV